MTSRTTLLLFLAHLLVYSARAVSGNWEPIGSQEPAAALVLFNQSSPESSSLGSVTLSLPGFYTEESVTGNQTFKLPLLENSSPILKAGAPDLSKLTITLTIPATGNLVPTLISSSFIDYPDFNIPPSAGNILHDGKPIQVLQGSEYTTNSFFPGNLYTLADPYIGRNTRYQSVQLFPFQYNPVTHVLRVYHDMEIALVPEAGNGINELGAGDLVMTSLKGLEHHAINTSIDKVYKGRSLPNELGSMLVICPVAYQEAMKPFVEWKLKSGIECIMEDASRYTTAEQLAAFIKETYYNHTDLSYVLLVGDASDVPTYTYPLGSSDNYYSYLAGNDHYPDLYVGRFSASTVRDVEVQVKRTIQYEQANLASSDWLSNATGIASTLSPGDDGEADYQHIRNLLNQLTTNNYSTGSEFFDGSQSGQDLDGDPTTQSVLNHFNEGTGLIVYAGHGSTSAWATGRITRSVVNSLNNKGMFPFIWSAACEAGNFAGSYCLAESWLQASTSAGEPLGAVAALMASGTQTSYPPMEGQDEMVRQLSETGKNGNGRTYGGLSVSGMYRMNDVYGDAGYDITDTWILFGDPSLQVRTSTPANIQVQHSGKYGLGMPDYEIHTSISVGYATLTCNGKILGKAGVLGGTAVIPVIYQPETDEIILTVTSFNCIPFTAAIELVKLPGMPLSLSPVNHSHRNTISGKLTWTAGFGAMPEYYKVYMGTNNPPDNILNGLISVNNTINFPKHLEYGTTYFWKLVAVNESGSTEGDVMQFETIGSPEEDFENYSNGNSPWTALGNSSWLPDSQISFHGQKSIRSGIIGNSETSSLLYPCEVAQCDFVGFWLKVSSQEESDKLMFFIDGILAGEWSGILDWTYASFKIDAGSHQLEWRYSKDDNGNAGSDAAWLDDISLPLHSALTLSLENQGSICEGQAFEPDLSLSNFNYLLWETNGDGTFDDNRLEHPGYIAGSSDIENGSVELKLTAFSFEGCPTLTSSVELHPQPLPVIQLPSDTIVSENASLVLDASSAGSGTYLWLPYNVESPSILVDTMGQERGSKTLTLKVTGENGCIATKTMKVHFVSGNGIDNFLVYPNPCPGTFTIEPESGAARLDGIRLINSEGKVVWQKEGVTEIINTSSFTLPELPTSTYYLVLQNSAGKFTRQLIVQ